MCMSSPMFDSIGLAGVESNRLIRRISTRKRAGNIKKKKPKQPELSFKRRRISSSNELSLVNEAL